jgi:MFS family permease
MFGDTSTAMLCSPANIRYGGLMSRRQLITLMVANFASFTSGIGLFSLLPIYTTRLGADAASTGTFLSSIFFAVALGAIIAGWLADRFQKRKLILIIGGALMVPLTWLMGSATTLSQLTFLTGIAWFIGSMMGAMVGILAGLFAEEHERGRVFGLLGIAVGIGGVLGSFAAGPIVDRWGFPALFQVAALGYAVVPLAGLFLADRVIPRSQPQNVTVQRPRLFANRTFLLLFCASVIIHIANSQISLTKPLMMDNLHFDATAISSAGAIGTLVGLPLPFFVGWLSDRLGRKPFIVLSYLTQVVSLFILTSGSTLPHFWMISILQGMIGSSMVAGQALVTDTFPGELLGRALSLFSATPWIGFVIGFSLAGTAMNAFGITSGLIIGVVIALVAILLLIPIQTQKPQPVVVG